MLTTRQHNGKNQSYSRKSKGSMFLYIFESLDTNSDIDIRKILNSITLFVKKKKKDKDSDGWILAGGIWEHYMNCGRHEKKCLNN